MKRLEITGERYGKLVALRRGSLNKNKRFNWHFRCDCGNEIELDANQARTGTTKSCGCYHAEALSLYKTTHGFTKNGVIRSEYRIWGLMKDRCSNPKSPNYANYGARGIRVCDAWMKFENFIRDVGDRPSEKHSIDRINVHGNYEPGNVRWATDSEQANNKSNTVFVEWDGEVMTISQWAEFLGVNERAFRSRLRRGWNFEVAVFTPADGKIRGKRAHQQFKAFHGALDGLHSVR